MKMPNTHTSNKLLKAYYKKTVSLRFAEKSLSFKVAQSLFSSYNIDVGTKRLLRTLVLERMASSGSILDVGCGYGPIGIFLKSLNPKATVHMVDRDALALEYTKLNTNINNQKNINVYGSINYKYVRKNDFDLIVSNIPAKIGATAIKDMILFAGDLLSSKGIIAVVVVDEINELVISLLDNPQIEIVVHKSWPGHHVYIFKYSKSYELANKPSANNVFVRNKLEFKVFEKQFLLNTVYDIAGFDTLSFSTQLMIDGIKKTNSPIEDNILVFNPGQGAIPVVLSANDEVEKIFLVSRDLLSLNISKENIKKNVQNIPKILVHHMVGIYSDKIKNIDNVFAFFPTKENKLVYQLLISQIMNLLKTGGFAYIVSNSLTINVVNRISKNISGFTLLKKTKARRNTMLILKKVNETPSIYE